MEIISLHKKCNKKARKVSQTKKASEPPKPDEGKKVSEPSKSEEPKKASGPVHDPSEEEQKPKKADGRNTTTKAGKKVKSPHSLKKHQKSLSLLIQTQMTQTMNKNNNSKKHQNPQSTQTMSKSLQ